MITKKYQRCQKALRYWKKELEKRIKDGESNYRIEYAKSQISNLEKKGIKII